MGHTDLTIQSSTIHRTIRTTTTSTMKFATLALVAFVAMTVEGQTTGGAFDNNGMSALTGILGNIENMGHGVVDLDAMEGRLQYLDGQAADFQAAETAITTNMDKAGMQSNKPYTHVNKVPA